MVTIANPIYDSVFKFLMQDTRVAKVLIQSLIGYTVEEVIVKNNEFVIIDIDDLRLSRVDFQAKVRISETETQLVTIELQKAFLETEYMRFRRYLGQHYINNENCVYKKVEKTDEITGEKTLKIVEYPNPIIQVYLLGHNLPEITTPISRSQLKFVDLDGNEVKNVEESLFVKSLTHRTIIVQIQRLPKKPKHKLEEIMSIFNHKAIIDKEGQTVKIDDYDNNSAEYRLIARRLQEAAVDQKVRQRMMDEDDLYRQLYISRMNAKYREVVASNEGHERGLAEGREKGLAEGHEKGLAEGVERGAREEKLAMARKMKTDGMPLDIIAKYTGLSDEEVNSL